MSRTRIVIVTPALAAANNGNWQTAARWRRFLVHEHAVTLTDAWRGGDEDLMIALHARRSAASVQAWREQFPQRPLMLVLTGTDLYRDIHSDASAQRSLQRADRLVVLNECGVQELPPPLHARTRVCLQSTPARRPQSKARSHLRVLMVGHLRDEKDPRTYFEAVRLLSGRDDILLDHIGGGLDAELAAEAGALARTHPHYRWLGALPHARTRERIARAHVLVHASRMEGGAHVVIEAVTCGTPVLASRIPGNLGLLGRDYPALFEVGDASGLATLLRRARDDAAMLPALAAACRVRAPLFAPAAERATLRGLVNELLGPAPI